MPADIHVTKAKVQAEGECSAKEAESGSGSVREGAG